MKHWHPLRLICAAVLLLSLTGLTTAQRGGRGDTDPEVLRRQVEAEKARLEARGARVKVTYLVEWAEKYPEWKNEVESLDGGYPDLAQAMGAARRIRNSSRYVTRVTITPEYDITWPPAKDRPQESPPPEKYYVPPGGKLGFDDSVPKGEHPRVRPEAAPEDLVGQAGKSKPVYSDAGNAPPALGSDNVISLRNQPGNPRALAEDVIVVWEKKNGKEVYIGTYPPGQAERLLKELKAGNPEGVYMRDPRSRAEAGRYIAGRFRKIEFVRPDWVDVGPPAGNPGAVTVKPSPQNEPGNAVAQLAGVYANYRPDGSVWCHLTLKQDGSFSYYWINLSNERNSYSGTWKYDPASRRVLISTERQGGGVNYHVVGERVPYTLSTGPYDNNPLRRR